MSSSSSSTTPTKAVYGSRAGDLASIPDYPSREFYFRTSRRCWRTGVVSGRDLGDGRPFRQLEVTHILGIEARGFILGGAIAARSARALSRPESRGSCRGSA